MGGASQRRDGKGRRGAVSTPGALSCDWLESIRKWNCTRKDYSDWKQEVDCKTEQEEPAPFLMLIRTGPAPWWSESSSTI